MVRTISHPTRLLFTVAAVALLAACADDAPFGPEQQPVAAAQLKAQQGAAAQQAFATLRRVTARYHDLNVAIADGFVLLHPCEERPDEGPVGTVYVHIDRLMDGIIDPASPDALIYEPSRNGRPKLVGAEFALPYALWSEPEPPEFLGNSFQREDEFGVWALHLWIWRDNPEGMFAESHPRVSCEAE
jgi:hypothetical protein